MIWDLLRALLVIEAVVILALSARVLWIYLLRYTLAHRLGAADRRTKLRGQDEEGAPARAPWVGLLPAHVWKLAAGVVLMAVALALLGIGRVDLNPVYAGVPLGAAVVGCGAVIWGLRDVLRYEHRLIS